jgi:hypothetical protein
MTKSAMAAMIEAAKKKKAGETTSQPAPKPTPK